MAEPRGVMAWKREYELGLDVLDAQHRALFAQVDELLAGIQRDRPDAVDRSLRFLRRYVLEHFAAEDGLMKASGYPRAAAHAAEHARLESELAALEAQRAADPTSPWLASKLAVGLASWLREHVLVADRELGRFLHSTSSEQGA